MLAVATSQRGDFSEVEFGIARKIIEEFSAATVAHSRALQLPRAAVRSNFPCDYIVVLDSESIFLAGSRTGGISDFIGVSRPSDSLSIHDVLYGARWEFDLQQAFCVRFPLEVFTQSPAERGPTIVSIANAFVESEANRMEYENAIVRIQPIFGPAKYVVNEKLVFVLMPFDVALTSIYNTYIKPIVERHPSGLVCKRADEISSHSPVIQDIWKSICEARIIVADLTNLNPNVMYELGIAHTLGKDTILIYRRPEVAIAFPFDLGHIRRIEYENTAEGGARLGSAFESTLSAALQPKSL